jgi:pimeloyl-ACP methyl ester carboxylesterase
VEVLQHPGGEFRTDTYFSVLEGVACAPSRSLDAPLSMRTTVILGALDPVIDADRTLDVAHRMFRHVDAHVFEGCGHWAHLEAPDRLVGLVGR